MKVVLAYAWPALASGPECNRDRQQAGASAPKSGASRTKSAGRRFALQRKPAARSNSERQFINMALELGLFRAQAPLDDVRRRVRAERSAGKRAIKTQDVQPLGIDVTSTH